MAVATHQQPGSARLLNCPIVGVSGNDWTVDQLRDHARRCTDDCGEPIHEAIAGDSTPFTRQDSVEETWRILRPLLEQPPPVHRYAPGTWGPTQADHLLAGVGSWLGAWVAS